MTHRTAYATKTSTYLERVFLKNNYNVDATNRNPAPVTTVTIPYIKDTSETISRILQPYSIRVAHKPTTALQHLLINYYANVGQGRTQQQTGSSLQDQMLLLPAFLYWWDWQKPWHEIDWTHRARNGDANNHVAAHHLLTNQNNDWDSAKFFTYSRSYIYWLRHEQLLSNTPAYSYVWNQLLI